MIPAVGKLFLTDPNVPLELCGTKLFVCWLTCTRVVGGHWTLAAYAMPGPLSETPTNTALLGCSATRPVSIFTARPEG